MDTILVLFLGGAWRRVDIFDDIPITLTIQQLDVVDLAVRKSTYSKTFTVPATSNNNDIFEHYYEVNGVDFNPLTKISAAVQYRGTDIFNGVLRLNSVTIDSNGPINYEVFLQSDVSDWVSEIKDLTLKQLNFTDLVHKYNYSSVTTSWSADTTDTNGLFGGKILYPMINYGLLYGNGTGATPDWTYRFNDANSFDFSGTPVPIQAFKPAIRIKEVLNRIFDETSYTIKGDFLDTDYFRTIYMSLFNNGQLGLGIQEGQIVNNQNIFKSFANPQTISYKGHRQIPFIFFDEFVGGYDPLDNFKAGVFRAPYQGTYYFNVRFNYISDDLCQTSGFFNIIAKKGASRTALTDFVYGSPNYDLGFDITTGTKRGNPNLFFSATLNAGEYLGLFIEEYWDYGAFCFSSPKGQYRIQGYDFGGIKDDFPMFDLYNSPTIGTGDTVDISVGIGDGNVVEFVKDIVTMFNLLIIEDEPAKTITFVPYNWYFNEPDRKERDWTQRLDLDSTYKIEPLSYELPKILNFQYDFGAEEYLNQLFENGNKYPFGRFRFSSGNNLLTGEETYQLGFAATPTTAILNGDNFIIPAVYREENGYKELPYQFKPHIFFWTGNRYAYKDQFKTQQGTWYLLSGTTGGTAIEWTTYPSVSHLSSLDIQIPNLVSDLSFGTDWDFFANVNQQVVWATPNNLYNLWWRDYIEENYSPETKRLTGKFFLRPMDLYETKFTDKIFVKDSFYRIEKINDGSVIENQLTEVQLIKESDGFYKIIPPAPVYFIKPNQAYPGLGPFNSFSAYTGTTIDTVCDGTASGTTLYTLGALPLTNNQQVLFNNGVGYIPVPIATYLRRTTESTTFIVIDNQGRILEQDC